MAAPGCGGFTGGVVVTTIETSVGAVTVKIVDPLTVPEVAVIVTVPGAVAVATFRFVVVVLGFGNVAVPPLNVVAIHVGAVSTADVPSLYVPVAVKASVVPLVMDGLAGVTAIDTSAAAFTVRTEEGEVTPPSEAVILVFVPIAASEVVANPGVVVLIVTPGKDEVHVTLEVMF